MAYGQTGSGKTYTMDGYNGHYGANYRTIEKIFELLEAKKWKALQQSQRRRNNTMETRQSRPSSYNRKVVTIAPQQQIKKTVKTDAAVVDETTNESDDDESKPGHRKISYKVELSMLEIYNEQVTIFI